MSQATVVRGFKGLLSFRRTMALRLRDPWPWRTPLGKQPRTRVGCGRTAAWNAVVTSIVTTSTRFWITTATRSRYSVLRAGNAAVCATGEASASALGASATYPYDRARSGEVIRSTIRFGYILLSGLCVLREIEGCLHQALRVVSSGGMILATSVGFVPLARDCADYSYVFADRWRGAGACVPGVDSTVEGGGNCVVARAAMLRLAWEELTSEAVDVGDVRC